MSEPTIEDAARLLSARWRLAAASLGRRAPHSPHYQAIYNAIAMRALADPQVALTPDERRLVAQFISRPAEQEARSVMLRVRLTESERADLQRRADQERMELSEYVRVYTIGPSDREWWRAGAVQQITAAAAQRHAAGELTSVEYDALLPRLLRLQVDHDDHQLMQLLHAYCPDNDQLNRYPA